ncbi:MAG TPA: 50S ribosomal protein L3 N(5)-glutamine methyltransferase [Chromatiaceae bacterium]|jgi:ribosomal protein L3 glutamine methyltransferase|nr:50S ribosomal protein L3 N(5)-glutamine methyltransferase [Chromatiaceae bacterium]HIA08255.1 50S ribosomal protein L3 N(5)-glutamine methyltransferase [Chromatiaceae bacterium]HIN82574.1 50S ribosomal protein L3 N(5)-glutamine methyltransferase [Chromatiales bacterium]HIO55158.1 50S ribosomal protein L3 N(5)-glutamine methyltransferase [Chromatiales bacterium]
MTDKQTDLQSLTRIRDWIRWAASRFSEAQLEFGHGTDNALDEAAALVLFALNLEHDLPPPYLAATVTAVERGRILELINTRVNSRKPLSYLTQEAWFGGHSFYVDERVLVPRSPIAELIAQEFEPWFDQVEPGRILDLCTGSGCIGIACAHVFPDAEVDISDVSADALDVALLNIARHGLQKRVNAIQSDLYASVSGPYDLIISNPPYVDAQDMSVLAQEYRHEPQLGLIGGDTGLDLVDQILHQAPKYLSSRGVLVVEVGNSAEALVARYPDAPFLWPQFSHGGHGVFMISAEDLSAWKN